MGNVWDSVKQFFTAGGGAQPLPSGAVIRTRTITLPPEQRLPRLTRTYHEVQLQPKPYWQSMGWTQNESEYRGTYQAKGRRFRGRIEHLYGNTWDFFVQIKEPWPKLVGHHKWPCFAASGADGWRKVHWKLKPSSLDSGIHSIERTLAESL